MTPELETYLDQLLTIRQDVPGIVAGLDGPAFNWRPASNRWSVGECLDHLNAIGEAYLPVLDQAVQRGRSAHLEAPGPFVYGWFERWFVGGMEPPARKLRTKAVAKFTPSGQIQPEACLTRFLALQDSLSERLKAADGLDLRRIKVRSQVAPISFTLGSTFRLLLAHERRHLWQAREVRKELERRASAP